MTLYSPHNQLAVSRTSQMLKKAKSILREMDTQPVKSVVLPQASNPYRPVGTRADWAVDNPWTFSSKPVPKRNTKKPKKK